MAGAQHRRYRARFGASAPGLPGNLDARYRLGAHCLLQNDHEGALEQYLEIMRRDRNFRDDAGRKALLTVFEMLKPKFGS